MRSQLQQSSRAELIRVLKVLDKALEPRTFLVGETITLADVAVATAVLLPFKYVSMRCNPHVCQHVSMLKHLVLGNLIISTSSIFFVLGIRALRQESLDQCYTVVYNVHKSATVPEGVGEDHSL